MKRRLAHSNHFADRKLISLLVLLIATVTVLMSLTSCGSSSDTTTSIAPASTSSAGAEVVMKDIAFDPAEVTIEAGGTVTWTNEDPVTHTVVGDNGEFESGELANGDSFSFTFDQPGTYSYHCSIHPSMTGTVVVQ